MMTVGDVPKGKIQSYYMKDNYYFQTLEKLETYGDGARIAGFERGITEREIKEFTKNRRTVAKDLTLSAPKSVSLEYSLGNSKVKSLIERAHDDAVKKTLDYAQKSGMIHYRYKDGGEVKSGEASNVIFALTKHEVSRECDPQLHTHCLLLNAGFDKQGNNRSLTYKVLMKNQEQLGNIYRHELAKEMLRLGYKIRTKSNETMKGVEKFYFELNHVTNDVIESFSTRREQIKLWQDEVERNGNPARYSKIQLDQISFYSTRKKKEAINPDDLRNLWSEKAKLIGFDPAKVLNDSEIVLDKKKIDSIYNQVINRSFETGVITTRHELLKKVQVQALKENQPFPLDEFNKRFEKDKKILALTDKSTKPYHAEITSLDIYHAEKKILDLVNGGKKKYKPITTKTKDSIPAWEERTKITLDENQAKSAKLILESRDFAIVIQGHAGTGKTTLLRAVNDIAVENEKKVYGLAPTGQAAKNLESETGIESKTIDSFLRCVKGAELKEVEFGSSKFLERIRRSTLLVDESSMVDLKKMEHLFDVAKTYQMKIAMIGDRFQFTPVGAGKPFMLIQDNTEIGKGLIAEIRRQSTPELRAVTESLAVRHNVSEAFDKLKELSKESNSGVTFKEIKSSKDRFNATIKDYLEKSVEDNKTFIMTGTNVNREAFNKEVRYQMRALGRLEGDDVPVQVMTGKNEAREIAIAQGDRLIFTKNETALYDVRNGTTGTVMGVSTDNENKLDKIYVSLDDGRQIKIDPGVYNKFEHAYSITFHKAQGQTVKSAIVSLSSKERLSFNKVYVALTRHKEKISVYADDFAKVAERAKNFEEKQSAYEIHKSRSENLPKDKRLKRRYKTRRDEHNASIEKAEGLGAKSPRGRDQVALLAERVATRLRDRGLQAALGPEGQKVLRTARKLYSVARMARVLDSFRASPAKAALSKKREDAVCDYATKAMMRAIERVPYLGTAIRLIRIISNISEMSKSAVNQIPVVGLVNKIR